MAASRTRTRPALSTRSASGRVGGGSFGVLFTRDALLEVFPHNVGYFLFGRHTGFAVYFLPGLMAILLFLAATRDRAMWQWLTLAAGVITAVVLLIYMPFTWSGGGGPVGNRYFLGTYGVFLFLVPRMQTAVGRTADHGAERAVRGTADLRTALRDAQSGGARQDRPVPVAADRVDDGQRSADQRRAADAIPPAAGRHAADAGVFHRRQRVQPRRRRVLGQGRIAAPTSCCARASRPRPTSPASRCRARCASKS